MGNKLEIESGNDSTNIQVAGNVSIGISAKEARQIAIDVFKANFYEFSEKAAKKALERAEEITDDFITKFYTQIPALENKLQEPSVQSSMFNTQKEFAKTGDEVLKEQLIDLLLQRINSEERSLKQIVLDESITILPKLTKNQIDILSLIFSAVYVNHNDIINIYSLENFFNNKLINFYPENQTSYSFFTHLQFTGCCTVLSEGSSYKPLIEIFKNRYKGLFVKGFSSSDFEAEFSENSQQLLPLLIHCLRNPELFQFNALNEDALKGKITKLNLALNYEKVKSFENRFLMNDQEIEQYFISKNGKSIKLFVDWKEKDFKTIRPTSVGLAIAIMNYNRQTNSNINFETFI